MHHDYPTCAIKGDQEKKSVKRRLARNLIQHIMALYDSIIQKIEHGIGLLWEEYFSEELFNIAKKRINNDLINNLQDLNDWFSKISKNIRDKVNNLSDNLISHFDEIIQEEIENLNGPKVYTLEFTKSEELQDVEVQKKQEYSPENKLNMSLYETCTQSSRGRKKKISNQHLEEVQSISVISQTFTQEASRYHLNQSKNSSTLIHKIPQQQSSCGSISSHQKNTSYQSSSKGQRISYFKESDDHDDYVQGGFYGVLLGLLEAFEL